MRFFEQSNIYNHIQKIEGRNNFYNKMNSEIDKKLNQP
jgi:hypothetical protein